jgi:hypothetical protein
LRETPAVPSCSWAAAISSALSAVSIRVCFTSCWVRGRAALPHVAGGDVGHQRAQRALHVQAVVLVEARVLDVDQRLLHHLGDLVAGDDGAVVLVERS